MVIRLIPLICQIYRVETQDCSWVKPQQSTFLTVLAAGPSRDLCAVSLRADLEPKSLSSTWQSTPSLGKAFAAI